MCLDYRRIQIMRVPIDLPLFIRLLNDLFQQRLPHPPLLPALKTAVDARPLAVTLWQVTPGTAAAQHPQDAIDDRAGVQRWTAPLRLSRWQQRLHLLPLFVGEFVSFIHPSILRLHSHFAYTP